MAMKGKKAKKKKAAAPDNDRSFKNAA